jgi:hypothetical protein
MASARTGSKQFPREEGRHARTVFVDLNGLVLAGVLASANPSAACSNCNCQSVQHIIVNCLECDTQIDTYPLQQGNYKSCILYGYYNVYCCNNPNVPEPSSENQGQCPGDCGPLNKCTMKVKGEKPSPLGDPSSAPAPQHR